MSFLCEALTPVNAKIWKWWPFREFNNFVLFHGPFKWYTVHTFECLPRYAMQPGERFPAAKWKCVGLETV